MRKLAAWLLVITMIAGSMTACDSKEETVETAPTGAEPTTAVSKETEINQTDIPNTEDTGIPIGHEDTYWVAEAYISEDGEWAGEPATIEPELWSLDLLIRVDGTACFRDIHEGICLTDDSYLNLVWERTPEGAFLFYSVLYPEPVLRGVWESGILSLEYWGTTLTMRRETMPQTIGQMYTPAELAGTWLMVSGETEGWQWEAMPNELSSIVFKVTSYDGPLILSADIEERDHYGNMLYSQYAQVTEVLRQPLYEGCENEAWSVRIGDASALDANGYPVETEFYATLLNDNTLLLQRYYTMDGYPAVSYQTFWRLPDLVSWMSHESMDLEYSNWVCTGYENHLGEELPLPAELEGFSVILDADQTCYVYYADGSNQKGTWSVENGGVLLLRGDENVEEPFWFGGVISGYWVDTTEGSIETYQMVLYCGGGLIKLSLNSYG